jgi:aminopeptidase N
VEEVLARTQACLRWYVPEPMRELESGTITRLSLEALPGATDDDGRITWLRAAIAAAATVEHLEPLLALADGTSAVAGVTVDQRMRWDLAVKAMAFGAPGADERLETERRRDPSDRGQRAHIRGTVARPETDAKAEAWDRIHGSGYGSFHLTRAAMEGFQWPSQRDQLRSYEDAFFDRVRDIFATRDYPFATAYMALLFPDTVPDERVLERGRNLLDGLGPEDVLLSRGLREKLDDVARAIRVRAVAEAAPPT